MDLDELVGAQRERKPQRMESVERTVVGAMALGLLLASLGLTFLLPNHNNSNIIVVVALVLMFAGAAQVVFEIGSTSCVATQLVFIPMLFLAPLPLVPLLVAGAYILAELPPSSRTSSGGRPIPTAG